MKKRIALLLLLGLFLAHSFGVRALADGAATSQTKQRLKEFRPTEKIPADDSISFPVDI